LHAGELTQSKEGSCLVTVSIWSLISVRTVVTFDDMLYISVQKKRLCVMPWVLCETASLLVQGGGVMRYIKHKINELDAWVLAPAIVNIGKIRH
jgi:hypothetical protein